MTAVYAGPWAITEPGVYEMSDADYHADPAPGGSLSHSGARLLLPPSCPARFAYERQHGRKPKKAWDIGHAAHRVVLGSGPELVLVRDEGAKNPDEWRTDAVKERVKDIRAAGDVPLRADEHAQVHAMAAALREHPIAGELLDPQRMIPEQSVFWVDDETGVWRRARLDAVSRPDAAGPPYVVDYKTAQSGDLWHISKALHNYGYAQQGDWYLDAGWAGGLTVPEAQFLLIVQETEPPYLVSVVEPDGPALRIGRQRNRQAIDIYRQCAETGVWPGHVPDGDIPLVSLPRWVERDYDTTEHEMEIL